MTQNVIRFYHDYMSHCGLEKTIQGMLVNYWFPSIRKKVQAYLNNCVTCLLFNTSSHSREDELQITDAPPYPMHTIHVDHFGRLKQSEEGFKHTLLAVDAYSRFTLLLPTKSTGTKETIKHLSMMFHIFGNTCIIVSDRGTTFTACEFSSFVKERKIYHRLIAVAAPWANEMVESVNRFLKSSISKIIDNLARLEIMLTKCSVYN